MNKAGYEEIKPVLVYDYNKNMGGVDKRDQMLHGYLVERKKGNKWYIKLFKRLLNISVLNSYIISKCHNAKQDHFEARLQLIQCLIEKYGAAVKRPTIGRPTTEPRPSRLVERHFIERIPPTEKKERPQRRCAVCSKANVRKDTYFWCPDCNVGLCIEPCFKSFHTKVNF